MRARERAERPVLRTRSMLYVVGRARRMRAGKFEEQSTKPSNNGVCHKSAAQIFFHIHGHLVTSHSRLEHIFSQCMSKNQTMESDAAVWDTNSRETVQWKGYKPELSSIKIAPQLKSTDACHRRSVSQICGPECLYVNSDIGNR